MDVSRRLEAKPRSTCNYRKYEREYNKDSRKKVARLLSETGAGTLAGAARNVRTRVLNEFRAARGCSNVKWRARLRCVR